MANGRVKIANNIEQVAQDIINYIFPYLKSPAEKKRHRNQLSKIFEEVLNEYQKPLIDLPVLAYIEKHYLNPYFRQRSLDIEATGKIIQESEDNERHIILQAITLLLEQGKCESTSANTLVLDLLIKQLDKYEPIDEDERFASAGWKAYGSRLGIRETLRDSFVKKAKVILENWEKERKEKNKVVIVDEIQAEEKIIKPLRVDPGFLEQLSLFRTGKSLVQNPKQKLKNETIAEIKSFEREVIVNPEQTAWKDTKHTIGCIEDYRPKVKEERKVNKLDLSKLKDVVEKLNSINEKKVVTDPEAAGIPMPPPPPVAKRKIGKISDKPMFLEAMRLLEEHTRARMAVDAPEKAEERALKV